VKTPDDVADFKRRATKMKVTNDGYVFTSEQYHSSQHSMSQQSMSQQSTPTKRSRQDERQSFSTPTPERPRLSSVGSSISSGSTSSDLGGLVVRVDFTGESPMHRNMLEGILTHIHTHMTVGLAGKEKVNNQFKFPNLTVSEQQSSSQLIRF
jgi:hypothetical protein